MNYTLQTTNHQPLNPTPYTLHPNCPYSLVTTPDRLSESAPEVDVEPAVANFKGAYTLPPKPYTQNPDPKNLNPTPLTLNR